MGISEECFIFDLASLPLEVARPIYPTMCTKVAVKRQSSSLISDITETRIIKIWGFTDKITVNRSNLQTVYYYYYHYYYYY